MLRRMLIGFAAAALLVGGAGATTSAAESTALPSVPFGFDVQASNGWSAEVLGGFDPKTDEGSIGVRFSRFGEGVIYVTRHASFTETTATADFGALGRIEVHSVPTGGMTTERSECGGRPVTFPSGRWEGTIDFHGEEGFSAIEATAGTASIGFELNLLCGQQVDEGRGGHSPGALLSYDRRHGPEQIEVTARTNRELGPAHFSAEISEEREGVLIARSVRAESGRRTFGFAIPPDTATARPPRPFEGFLQFVHERGSRPRISGDLTVDFPGRADVRVLGPGKTHASLVRAVLNPSHPF
jgi:hypothetical protein